MRVYINQLNIDLANDFAKIFQPFLHNTLTYTEVFTDEGWYQVEDKFVYQLDAKDAAIVSYPGFYKDVTLIADKSWTTKQKTSSLGGGPDHVAYMIRQQIYKMPTHTHVHLVMEFSKALDEDHWRPKDVYFEQRQGAEQGQNKENKATKSKRLHEIKASIDQRLITNRDIDDLFVKNELIEFLSYLF